MVILTSGEIVKCLGLFVLELGTSKYQKLIDEN